MVYFTNQEIVDKIRSGSLDELEQVFLALNKKTLGLVISRGGNVEDGKGMFAETYCKVCMNVIKGGYVPREGISFEKYFMTAAFNIWMDELKKRNKEKEMRIKMEKKLQRDNPFQKDEIEEKIENDKLEEKRLLCQKLALDIIKEPCKSLLIKHHFEEISPSILAEEAGINSGTMRTRLSRCLDKLEELAKEIFKTL